MDSITQALLGGAVAAAFVPAGHRRAALLAGAALGTLPDLDSLPLALLTGDPVLRMTWHRGPSHSLFVLPVLGWLLWMWFRGRGGRVGAAPGHWFRAIQLALLTHPLLDAFTVYGTQLFWPLPLRPAMWSSVFIIDPLYTVWLLLAVAVAAFAGSRRIARHALVAGLVASTAYLGWSLAAKSIVDRRADEALVAAGLGDAPRFSAASPFNTLLWRVVAMTPDGFVEGETSLVADEGPVRFRRHVFAPEARSALAVVDATEAVARLRCFNHGFMKPQVRDGRLVLSDLRMGAEPDYTFNFAVAERHGAAWRPIPPEQLRWPWEVERRLAVMWNRIWTSPRGASAGPGQATGP
ncbi:metal-dependent hydrolase [Luteimonas pelagia]